MQSRALSVSRTIAAAILLLSAALASPASIALDPVQPGLQRSESPLLSLDPNRQAHPESSLVDFSSLLDAPAGKHGFMTTGSDGHFYFADGTRARFWGINVAAESVFQSHKTIDDTVAVLARAGINLVRIHEIDQIGGVIDYTWSDSQHLSAARLRTLDYWVKRCRDAGIYVYLDLLDYRTFRRADGVPNATALGRAAKPYSVFDHRLIELQEEYARRLLSSHINSYTGLSYARDPAVCMVELFDENGLFIKRTMLHSLAAPYREELVRKWNQWLRVRYQTSARLYASWTNGLGQHALRHGEYIERGTVKLPDLLLNADWDRPYAGASDSPARLNDAALFAYSLEVRYCSEMKHFLRGIGVRVPICAVGSQDVLADTKALSDVLDFVGNNFYWDHPSFRPESNWKLPSFFNSHNPIQAVDEYSFAPTTAFFKVRGKPLVIREWNYCWPNRYRDAGMLEAAVYACLQDVDAMILFTYDTSPRRKELSYFDVSHDPDRWASVGPLAAVFLERLVKPARTVVDVGFSSADIFHYHGYLSSVYTAGWTSRVENVFFDHVFPRTDATLVVASGRSSSAAYPIDHAIIRTNDRYDHITGGLSTNTSAQRSGYAIPVDWWPATTYAFAGDLLPADARVVGDAGLRFRTAAVNLSKCRPIGISVDGSHCLGFYDPVRDNYV
ncbi:MAG: hypothetical protein LC772_03910, partial [Chloroflexi bacterium]|nr:hypothetical protein [Chloroflexota bacterium]